MDEKNKPFVTFWKDGTLVNVYYSSEVTDAEYVTLSPHQQRAIDKLPRAPAAP